MNVLQYFEALLGVTFSELPEVHQQIILGASSFFIAGVSIILIYVIFMFIKGLTHDR